MKTSALLITVVVMLHCAALGSLFFIQGCGTTARTGTPPPAAAPDMPPTTREAVTYPAPKPDKKAPAVKPAAAEPHKAVETTEYVVRSGDTVGGIAKQYEVSRGEIVELNKLSDPNKLRAGQKLLLPGRLKIKPAPAKHAVKAKAVEPAPAVALAPGAGGEYVVQSGDSLSKIAKKHGTTIAGLREANKLHRDLIRVGQKLVIPGAATEPAAPAPAPADVPPGGPAPAIEFGPLPAGPAPVEAPAKPLAGSGITHIVQPDEDIASIAKLYAVTVDEIAEINQLGAAPAVKAGQQLKIP